MNVMIINFAMSDYMWGELYTTCCIVNKVPHDKLNNTPYNMFFRMEKLNYVIDDTNFVSIRSIPKFMQNVEICKPRKKAINSELDSITTTKITIVHVLIALATIHNVVIHQMGVKTIFLNGDLEKENYMKQLEGFIVSR
ncbi:hypothetical protein CR513_29386, partial [Mucuna pruriens]